MAAYTYAPGHLFDDSSAALSSVNQGARTQNLMQVRPDGTTGTYAGFNGTLTFTFRVDGATKWLPNESYLSMRMQWTKLTQGSGSAAGPRAVQSRELAAGGDLYGDNLAPINNPVPFCFSRVTFKVQGQQTDETLYVGVTDTMLALSNTTRNYRKTLGTVGGWGTFPERALMISNNRNSIPRGTGAPTPEYVWVPCLGIFSVPHAVPGGYYQLELQVDPNWQQVIAETTFGANPGDPAAGLIAGTDYRIDVTDLTFWLQTVEETIPRRMSTWVADYRGSRCQLFPITGSAQNHLSVATPESIIKFVEGFRDTRRGLNTVWSASNFDTASLTSLRNTIPSIGWTRPQPDLQMDFDAQQFGKAYMDFVQAVNQDTGECGAISIYEWSGMLRQGINNVPGTPPPYFQEFQVSGAEVAGLTYDISPPQWPLFAYRVVRPPGVGVAHMDVDTNSTTAITQNFFVVMIYSAAMKIMLDPATGSATGVLIDQTK